MASSILDPSERNSAVWQIVRAHIMQRIETLQKANEFHHPMEKTSEIRGSIKELRKLFHTVEPVELKTRKDRSEHDRR